jgi:hypothetical protein
VATFFLLFLSLMAQQTAELRLRKDRKHPEEDEEEE